jgi:hypothetical protein
MNTKTAALVAALAGALLAISPSPALAVETAPAGPMRPGGGRGPRNFDPATVTTVAGEVTEVHRIEAMRGQGVHLELKTADGVLAVHLGPAWFLDSQALKVQKGDKLEVTGSKVELGGPALIAQVVKRGDASLTLRDANGIPLWARRGRR